MIADRQRPSRPPSDELAYLALVNQMAEPLTALSAYLRTASHFLRSSAVSPPTELIEIAEKALVQTVRAGEILHRLRDLLHQKE